MLDQAFVQDVTKIVRDSVKQTLSGFKKPTAGTQPDTILSQREQLERFVLMTPDHLTKLKLVHGEKEFSRYVQRMREIARTVK